MKYQEDAELSELIKTQANYYEAPQGLRNKISNKLVAVETSKNNRGNQWWSAWQLWLGMGGAFACGVMLSVAVMISYGMPAKANKLLSQVIDGHVRSLMVAHLSDVASTDQHTVKPWFNGKLNYSPPVKNLVAEGFPLIGGRLDYMGERTVAALVYRHQLHTINLFVWPVSSNDTVKQGSETRQGFNVINWLEDGMEFWAVSDLNSSDLKIFAKLLQQQAKS